MKYLPSTLLIAALALALHAQAPKPEAPQAGGGASNPTPAAVPPGDPFVKNPGDNPANEGEQEPPNIVVIFESYAMSMDEAAALLATESGSVARYRHVLDLAKTGKARLQTLTALNTKSGQRAVAESLDAVRFATEFSAVATGRDLPTPTAWETRQAGDTFEFEPVISPDQKVCDLNLVPARVTLAGFQDIPGMPDDAPGSYPLFHTQKITTSVGLTVGEPFYLGTFSPPRAQGPARGDAPVEMCLSFVHAYSQQPPAMDKKAALKPDELAHANLDYICYSLDRTAAREILAASASITAPWEKLQALVAGKKAKLEFVSSVRTRSGQRMVTEEIQEVPVMAEYNPANVARWQETAETTDPKGNASDKTIDHFSVTHGRIPGYATNFEIRNAGISVEVEPVIRPDLNVDVNHVIQNVNYLGMLKVNGVAARYQPQPLFQTSKVTTSITVLTGKHTLVGTLNPPGADGVNDRVDTGRTWLLFVGATISDR